MNGPLDPWQIATGFMTLYAGLLTWVGRRHVARIDDVEHDVRKLDVSLTRAEGTMLKKEDLLATETRLLATLSAQHTTIIDREARIEKAVDKAHERTDTLNGELSQLKAEVATIRGGQQ